MEQARLGCFSRNLAAQPGDKKLDDLPIRRVQFGRLLGRRRRGGSVLLGLLQHVDQHLGRAQIGAGRFVDQLRDDRLALGDLAPLSVNRGVGRLVQRGDQQRRQVLAARVAGLAPLEAGVARRLAVTHLIIVPVGMLSSHAYRGLF